MNITTEAFSYVSLALLPMYLLYLNFFSTSIEEKYARDVVRNQQYFRRRRHKMRAWRVSFLYETFKDELALSPKMNFCVEVNMGWFFAPRWKLIMIAPASGPKQMLDKFRKAEMGRLPKNLQVKDHAYTAGEDKAWKLTVFFITAFPFAIEVARAFIFS